MIKLCFPTVAECACPLGSLGCVMIAFTYVRLLCNKLHAVIHVKRGRLYLTATLATLNRFYNFRNILFTNKISYTIIVKLPSSL